MNKNRMKLCAALLVAAQIPTTVFATDWCVNGSTSIKKSDERYNINPWNTAEITAGAADGKIKMVTEDGIVEVNTTPLYSLSEAYTDRVTEKDGIWGVERNVTVTEFDGSEDWELYKQPGYINDSTVIFTCTAPDEYRIQNGISTHFDVVSDKTQKNSIYDGISFGRENGTILMRFMNVRGISDVDSLKKYLKGQHESGNGVKLIYPAAESEFVPFDDDVQEKLDKSEVRGIAGGRLLKIEPYEELSDNGKLTAEALGFLKGISEIMVENADDGLMYYMEGIYVDDDSVTVEIIDSDDNIYSGSIDFKDTDFLKQTITEIIVKGHNDTVIRLGMDLSKTKIPYDTVNGFNIRLADSCIKESEIILPRYMPIAGGDISIYPENAVMYGNDRAEAEDITEDEIEISFGDKTKTIELKEIGKTDDNKDDLTVLFLGDSLINENYYTEAVKKLNPHITFLGTRGNADAPHEGRGGWSAYDYCNETSKYGFTNPFLFDGEFDFERYMQTNNYKNVDTVVLNLGINDLNLTGHNSHEEILGYFDTIINSIHEYDENIDILINTPIMPYAEEKNTAYKNDRLEFIKSLYGHFGDMEEDGIIIVPTYLAVDPHNGYKLAEPIIDEFNQDYGLVVNDATHPNKKGYKQMAEITCLYMEYGRNVIG